MAQRFHKFKAETFEQAYQAMRRKLGDDAIVVRTTTVTEGGILGFLGQKMVELTASGPETPAQRPRSAAERRYLSVSEDPWATSSTQRDAGPGAQAPNAQEDGIRDTVAYFQRLVREAQSRMNEGSASEPAGASPSPENAAHQASHARPNRETGAEAPRMDEQSPIIPFRRRDEEPQANEGELRNDIRAMRDMLQVLFAEIPGAGLPAEFMPAYHHLVDNGMTRQTAASLITTAIQEGDKAVLRDRRVLNERLKMEIRKTVHVTGGIALSAGSCRRVALVGATGVGKTTNLAKLAALFAVRERARVAMVTADTYRVAAPEQLRVYANIVGLDLEVVNDAREMAAAIRKFRAYDLVLIDTAGGSPYNDTQLEEMAGIVEAAQPDDVLFVVSALTPLEDMRETLSRFSRLRPTSLLFTKLDETHRFGAMVCLARESELPLSYFSTGQNVPDDLTLAHAGMLADLMLENGENRGRASSKTA